MGVVNKPSAEKWAAQTSPPPLGSRFVTNVRLKTQIYIAGKTQYVVNIYLFDPPAG